MLSEETNCAAGAGGEQLPIDMDTLSDSEFCDASQDFNGPSSLGKHHLLAGYSKSMFNFLRLTHACHNPSVKRLGPPG